MVFKAHVASSLFLSRKSELKSKDKRGQVLSVKKLQIRKKQFLKILYKSSNFFASLIPKMSLTTTAPPPRTSHKNKICEMFRKIMYVL